VPELWDIVPLIVWKLSRGGIAPVHYSDVVEVLHRLKERGYVFDYDNLYEGARKVIRAHFGVDPEQQPVFIIDEWKREVESIDERSWRPYRYRRHMERTIVEVCEEVFKERWYETWHDLYM